MYLQYKIKSFCLSILTISIYICTVQAAWYNFRLSRKVPEANPVLHARRTSDSTFTSSASDTPSDPGVTVVLPSKTSQGMLVQSIVPLYRVCDIPISTSTAPEPVAETGQAEESCSTKYTTVTTPYCSTVLTGFFTKITVTDCEQNITFSTRTSYSLSSSTYPTEATPTPALIPRDVTEDVAAVNMTERSVIISEVLYLYVSPWRPLASGKPSLITVKKCTRDAATGEKICDAKDETQEEWDIGVECEVITKTKVLIIDERFDSEKKVIILGGSGPTPTLTAPEGDFRLSTQIEYKSTSKTTMTSTITSTKTSRTPSPDPSTGLAQAAAISTDEGEPTTTRTETRTRTTTVTVSEVFPDDENTLPSVASATPLSDSEISN